MFQLTIANWDWFSAILEFWQQSNFLILLCSMVYKIMIIIHLVIQTNFQYYVWIGYFNLKRRNFKNMSNKFNRKWLAVKYCINSVNGRVDTLNMLWTFQTETSGNLNTVAPTARVSFDLKSVSISQHTEQMISMGSPVRFVAAVGLVPRNFPPRGATVRHVVVQAGTRPSLHTTQSTKCINVW